jgi:cyclic pyranopterin phosphate synthase
MPEEGMKFVSEKELMSFDQISEVVEVMASLGLKKIRITGGEPLLRRNLEELIVKLSRIHGIEDISMTTNGLLFADKAEMLKKAGLNRVNFSLDTLDPERFAMITRGGQINRVYESIQAAFQYGFDPIKVNVVLMKGINDDEIDDFLKISLQQNIHVRFIEYMPIGHNDDSWRNKYLPLETVFNRCEQNGWMLDQLDESGSGPSQNYRISGAKGVIGLVHPVSEHFCGSCNRLRLTATGYLKPCLFWSDELNVKAHLGNRDALKQLISKALDTKPLNHEMARAYEGKALSYSPTICRMSQIGG